MTISMIVNPSESSEAKLRACVAFSEIISTIAGFISNKDAMKNLQSLGDAASNILALTDQQKSEYDHAIEVINSANKVSESNNAKAEELDSSIRNFNSESGKRLEEIENVRKSILEEADAQSKSFAEAVESWKARKAKEETEISEARQLIINDTSALDVRSAALDSKEVEVNAKDASMTEREAKSAIKEDSLKNWDIALNETQEKINSILATVKISG